MRNSCDSYCVLMIVAFIGDVYLCIYLYILFVECGKLAADTAPCWPASALRQ